jgi:Dolichyl-phosphate-mannose-protein mannosyltransferase
MLDFPNWEQPQRLFRKYAFAQSADVTHLRIWYVHLALGLVVVGVIGRLVRYFLQFPIWGDEAFVAINFLHRDFAGMLHGLEYFQIAPVLFLWGELAVTKLLGPSELALRLLPSLASLASLALFWRLAWSTVPPLAALFAVGLLAVARWPVTMGAFVKPYSCDLLMALVLLVPASEWLRRPQQLRWLVVLVLATPIALSASYPTLFVAGGVGLALLPTAWGSRWAGRGLFIAYNAFVAVALILNWYAAANQQHDAAWLQQYWGDAFPPWSLWPLVEWLVLIHVGQLMAYPAGGSNGASVVTTVLFAIGVCNWWKEGRRSLLVLMLTPIALNLLAATLRIYPYGIPRLSQNLAPAICLLAGTGLMVVLERFIPSDSSRPRAILGVVAVLAFCAVAGLVLDLVRPYRDEETRWLKQSADAILGRIEPDDELVVLQDPGGVAPTLRWYLESRYRAVRWHGQIDWDRVTREHRHLVTVIFWKHRNDEAPVPPTFEEPAAHGWATAEQSPYTTQTSDREETSHIAVRRWAPPTARKMVPGQGGPSGG